MAHINTDAPVSRKGIETDRTGLSRCQEKDDNLSKLIKNKCIIDIIGASLSDLISVLNKKEIYGNLGLQYRSSTTLVRGRFDMIISNIINDANYLEIITDTYKFYSNHLDQLKRKFDGDTMYIFIMDRNNKHLEELPSDADLLDHFTIMTIIFLATPVISKILCSQVDLLANPTLTIALLTMDKAGKDAEIKLFLTDGLNDKSWRSFIDVYRILATNNDNHSEIIETVINDLTLDSTMSILFSLYSTIAMSIQGPKASWSDLLRSSNSQECNLILGIFARYIKSSLIYKFIGNLTVKLHNSGHDVRSLINRLKSNSHHMASHRNDHLLIDELFQANPFQDEHIVDNVNNSLNNSLKCSLNNTLKCKSIQTEPFEAEPNWLYIRLCYQNLI